MDKPTMPGLAQTTAALKRYRQQAAAGSAFMAAGQPRLSEVTGFGSNPGGLRMFVRAPSGLAAGAPLVLALHGCTQSAEDYQHGAGWANLADRCGFVLLAPQQETANNINRCFNWFEPGDTTRGHGEIESIRQMIARAIADHGIDRSRIFITGLSAGGAMTSAMLAAYPELFAGGAIIAGLPAGAASSVQEAFTAMFQGASRPAETWGDAVRGASSYPGPWPAVSVWQGEADTTVTPANAEEIVRQWTNVHGLAALPETDERVGAVRRRVWKGADGRPLVQAYTIRGMGHGAPVSAGGADGVGAAGPFFIDVGLPSSLWIAQSWGVAPPEAPAANLAPLRAKSPPAPSTAAAEKQGDILSVINKALKSAGLMR